MVIDNNDKFESLIDIKDEMAIINTDYESFMYYANKLDSLLSISMCSNGYNKINGEEIHGHLIIIFNNIRNIENKAPSILKEEKETKDKVKLVCFGIMERCKELSSKFNNEYKKYISSEHEEDENLKKEDILLFVKNELNELNKLTNKVNDMISEKILSLNENHIPTKILEENHLRLTSLRYAESERAYSEQQNLIVNWVTGVSIFIILLLIGLVVYAKSPQNVVIK